MNLKNTVLIFFLFILSRVHGQEIETINQSDLTSAHFGYYAPFLNHLGMRAGIEYLFKSLESETRNKNIRIHQLNVAPHLAYFVNPKVQQNYFLDLTIEYRWFKPDRKICPKAGIGLGYLLARQNIGGTVNLGNGDITFEKRSLNFVVPTVFIGLETNSKKQIGYYMSMFYGRKFTNQEVNSDFIGLEFGVTYNFQK